MNIRNVIAAALILAALASGAWATPSLTAGGYTQNFNGMSTGTAAPDGWAAYSITGSHDQFKPADDLSGTGALPTSANVKAGTVNNTLIAATPDTSTTQKSAQGYNWAIGGSSSERALGTSPTGIAAMVLQLTITNSTGMDISTLNIDYNVRVLSTTTNNNNYTTPYASGTTAVEELPGYWLWYSLDGGNTYTNVASLDANGHTWANALGTVHESADNYALSGTWAAGSNITFRFFDDNAQGPSPDQRLGLDNVVLGAVPEPATMGLLVMGGLTLIARKRRSR